MISVIFKNLPEFIPGFTLYNIEEDYTVVINSNTSLEKQIFFYKAESNKIESGFYVEEILNSYYI